MDEVLSQSDELLIGKISAFTVIGIVLLLLSNTNAGILRSYMIHLLEAAC